MANLNIPATRDRTLDAFKGKMIGGGTRSILFEVELYFPMKQSHKTLQKIYSRIKLDF